MALAALRLAIQLDNDEFDRDVENSKQQLSSLVTDTKALAAGAGALLVGAGAALGGLASNLKGSADEALRARQNLAGAFSGLELDAIAEQVLDMGATPPITEAQFVRLAKTLKTFEKDVTGNLGRIANAAVQTEQPVQTVADAFAKFGVDERATKQLEKLLNISTDDLVEAGAVLDDTGKKISFVGDNAALAQAALEKIFDERFSGAADRVVTATDKLNGEFIRMKQEAGEGLTQLQEVAAEALLPVAEAAREVAAELGPITGIGLAVGSALATMSGTALLAAAGISQVAVNFVALSGVPAIAGRAGVALATLTNGALSGLTVALNLLPLAGVAAGLLLIGKVAYDVINDLEYQTDKTNELIAVENERINNARRLLDIVGQTTDELRKQGVTSQQVVATIFSLQEQIEQARKVGNTSLENDLKAQVGELQRQKRELSEIETGAKKAAAQAEKERIEFNTPEAIKAREAAAKAQEKADKEAEQKRRADLDESLAAELDGIALKLAQEKITLEQSLKLRKEALQKFEADESRKRQLAIETARVLAQAANQQDEDVKAKAEADRKKRLSDALAEIRLRTIANNQSAAEEAAALQTVLNTFKLTEDEKRSLIQQTAQARAKARAEEQKASEDALRQAQREATELTRLQSEGRQLATAEIDREIQNLEQESEDKGVDNTAAIRRAYEEKLALSLEQIRIEEQAAISAATNAEQRAQIEANTQAKIRAEIADTNEAFKRSVDQRIAEKKRLEGDTKKSTFGDVFGIEELGERLRAEQATTRRQSTITQAAVPALVAQIAPVPAASAGLGREKVDVGGDININLDVTSSETTDVKFVGSTLGGRFNVVARAGRGMKGRPSVG